MLSMRRLNDLRRTGVELQSSWLRCKGSLLQKQEAGCVSFNDVSAIWNGKSRTLNKKRV